MLSIIIDLIKIKNMPMKNKIKFKKEKIARKNVKIIKIAKHSDNIPSQSTLEIEFFEIYEKFLS